MAKTCGGKYMEYLIRKSGRKKSELRYKAIKGKNVMYAETCKKIRKLIKDSEKLLKWQN